MAMNAVSLWDFRAFLGECFGVEPDEIWSGAKLVDLTSSLGLMYFALQINKQYGVDLPLSSHGFSEETTVIGALELINGRAA